jgi:hypothetical protein
MVLSGGTVPPVCEEERLSRISEGQECHYLACTRNPARPLDGA